MKWYERDTHTGVVTEGDFTLRDYFIAQGFPTGAMSSVELDLPAADMPPSMALQLVNAWNRSDTGVSTYYIKAEDAGL